MMNGKNCTLTGGLQASQEAARPQVLNPDLQNVRTSCPVEISLLTGGGDKPYALGMALALSAQNIRLDYIGSSEVDSPELHQKPLINFLNLRGDQKSDVRAARKVFRVLAYYWRLILYVVRAKPRILHILWNDRLQYLDRTVLMLFYKLLGKRIAFTAHNVNARKRDGNDSILNRATLKIQYQFADHIFVHTQRMKHELLEDFRIPESKVSVIPFGINNTLPNTKLTKAEARRKLGVGETDKILLFFGHIAPYKGLEDLIVALGIAVSKGVDCRLVIAGEASNAAQYWNQVRETIARTGTGDRVIERISFIPDDQVEVFFKAADILVLPYKHIFQSGVLFLGYSFGLPVIAADVGSLREDVIDGRTGFLFRPTDTADLAKAIGIYFSSSLFRELENRQNEIREYANNRYSWTKVGETTLRVYKSLIAG